MLKQKCLRGITAINDTKIKYIAVEDKLYKVTHINFSNLTLEASETDLLVSDVPEENVFILDDFKEFRVTLRNWHGVVIDFAEYVREREKKS